MTYARRYLDRPVGKSHELIILASWSWYVYACAHHFSWNRSTRTRFIMLAFIWRGFQQNGGLLESVSDKKNRMPQAGCIGSNIWLVSVHLSTCLLLTVLMGDCLDNHSTDIDPSTPCLLHSVYRPHIYVSKIRLVRYAVWKYWCIEWCLISDM